MTRAKNPTICPTCHSELIGKYCHNCGEKQLSSSDYSLRRFIEESVDLITHYDSKLYRSLRLLMSTPGFLTAEYFKGRRKPYVKPLQLFLLINIAYFLAVSFFGWITFATHLDTHRNNAYYGTLARTMVDARVAERNVTPQQYQTTFDRASTTFSKSLIFIMIPFVALILQALYWRPRRYYVENLVFSIHLFSYLLVYLIAVGIVLKPALLELGALTRSDLTGYMDYVGTIIVAVAMFAYLYFALRRARHQSVLLTLTKAALITYLSLWVLWIYRFFLFLICFYFT